MDLRTRDSALVNSEHYRRRPVAAGWVLERFPPVLAAARTMILLGRKGGTDAEGVPLAPWAGSFDAELSSREGRHVRRDPVRRSPRLRERPPACTGYQQRGPAQHARQATARNGSRQSETHRRRRYRSGGDRRGRAPSATTSRAPSTSPGLACLRTRCGKGGILTSSLLPAGVRGMDRRGEARGDAQRRAAKALGMLREVARRARAARRTVTRA